MLFVIFVVSSYLCIPIPVAGFGCLHYRTYTLVHPCGVSICKFQLLIPFYGIILTQYFYRYAKLLNVQVPGREIPPDAQDRLSEILSVQNVLFGSQNFWTVGVLASIRFLIHISEKMMMQQTDASVRSYSKLQPSRLPVKRWF